MKKTILACLAACLISLNIQAQSSGNYRDRLRDQNVKITDTNLPIIFIEVGGKTIQKNSYILGRMKVIDNGPGHYNYGDTVAYPDQHIDYEGPIAIRYRGNTSFSNSDKKPLQLRTLKEDVLPDDGGEKQKVSILGMGKDNKWMFIAPWADKVMFRDILSFELARPWMDYVPTVKLCEVYLDGIYYGVYGFGERVSKGKHRLNLHDPGEDGGDLTGDYHVEIDRSDDPYYPSKYRPWSSLTGGEERGKTIKYQYKDPENDEWADFPGAKEALNSEIDKMEASFTTDYWQDPERGYQSKIDMMSFIDYMLSTEIANNIDGYRLSTNLYKYGETRAENEGVDPRWKMSLWDFNIAWGNANYYNGQRTDSWHYTFNLREQGDAEHLPFYWYKMLGDKNYVDAMKARWKEYRANNYSDKRIMATIDSLALQLRIRGAVDRNQKAWGIIGRNVWPNPFNGNSYDEELSYLKQWVKDRLAFMDKELENLDAPDPPKPAVPKNTEPVAVISGMNADVIVEQLPANTHATLGIDGGNRTFYSATVKADGGLPEDRTVTSVAEEVEYVLADYAADNALALRGRGESATAEFQPFATTDLYILATSANGQATMNAVINYTDESSDEAGELSIRDWSLRNPDGTQAIAGLGNINMTTDAFNSGDCHDALYDLHITADETKLIQSVTFTTTNDAHATIFAFARQIVEVNDYEPLEVKTGWNADVIAETQDMSSITETLDGNYAFYAAAAYEEGGLPDSRTIKAPESGVSYTLAPYAGNNALKLASSGQAGTLTFGELFNTPELHLLATSTNGASTVAISVIYEDGTAAQSNTITINDWYVTNPNGTEALSGLGRVNKRGGFTWGFSPAGNFALFDFPVAVDETKNIKAVSIRSRSSSIPCIFALSKKKTDVVPGPITDIKDINSNAQQVQTAIYDLQGRRINTTSAPINRGVYILNNRKIIIR